MDLSKFALGAAASLVLLFMPQDPCLDHGQPTLGCLVTTFNDGFIVTGSSFNGLCDCGEVGRWCSEAGCQVDITLNPNVPPGGSVYDGNACYNGTLWESISLNQCLQASGLIVWSVWDSPGCVGNKVIVQFAVSCGASPCPERTCN